MTRSVGNYRLLQELGEGAMGTVYRALDTQLEREVAMKSLRSELAGRADIVERFREEAKLQGKLESMHVVRLYQFLREGDEFFMVMEFVKGKTLGALLKEKGRLTPKDAIEIMLQALDGLGYAHKRKIVHRDVKPANIMVSEDGVVKVADFGIARLVGSARQTKIGSVVGTLEYISPEAVQGRESTAVSDIYSCGVVLYELLTGHLPFSSTNEYELASCHVQTPPPPPRKWITDLPKDLEAVVMKALMKKPVDRFQSAEQMANTLKTCLAALSGEVRQERGFLTKLWSSSRADVPPPLPVQESPPPDDGLPQAINEGRSLLDRGLPEQAKVAIENALQQYPGDPELRELQRRADADLAAVNVRSAEVNQLASKVSELQRDGKYQDAVAVALDAVARLPNQPEVTALLMRAVKAQKIDACRQQVEGLKKSESWDAAFAAIDELLKIYSREQVLLDLRQGVDQERETKRQVKEVEAVLSHVADLQRNGQMQEAERAIHDALARTYNDPSLAPRLAKVAETLRAARLKAMAAAAIGEARTYQKRREWAHALDILNAALRESPKDAQLAELRSEIEKERDKYLAEVRQTLDEGRKLLAAHRFEDALVSLSTASQRYPNEAAVTAMLLEAQQKLAAERKEQQLEKTRAKANDFLVREAFTEAEQFLLDAISQFPGDPRLTDLLSSAIRGRREQEKKRAIDAALTLATQLAGKKLFADAIRELDGVLAVFPAEPSVEHRRAELALSLREERRVQTVTELRGWSKRYGENFDSALADVDKALLEYPNDPDLTSIRVAIERDKRFFECLKAEQDTAARTAEMEEYGQFKEAHELAEAVAAQYPESQVLTSLPAAIMRRWEEAYQLRRAGDAEREIRRLLGSGNPHFAVEPMEAALVEFPRHEGLVRLRVEVQTAVREYDAQEAARLVHDAIAHRDWSSAESAVHEFEGKYGSSSIGTGFRSEVAQARKARQELLDGAIARARASLTAKDFIGAISLIDSLGLADGERPEATALLSTARDGLEDQAYEKRFQELRDRVSNALESGDLPSANSLLAQARTDYEDYAPFRELEEKVRREDGIRSALEKALEEVGARAWEQAIGRLESAAEQFGKDRRISDLIAQVRQERQARRASAEAALAESRALWEAGQHEQSVERLTKAADEIPEEPSLAEALDKARREWSSLLRTAKLRSLEEHARSYLAANQPGQAENLLEEVRGDLQGETVLLDLLQTARTARLRLDEIKRCADSIQASLHAQDPVRAEWLLTEALRQFPDDPTLRELQGVVAEATLAAALYAGRQHFLAGRLQEAKSALAVVIGKHSEDSRLTNLQGEIEKVERRRAVVDPALSEARVHAKAGRIQVAIRILDDLPAWAADDPAIAELRALCQQSLAKQAEEFQKTSSRAEELIQRGLYDEAVALLETASADQRLQQVLQPALERARAIQRSVARQLNSVRQTLSTAGPAAALELIGQSGPETRRHPDFESLRAQCEKERSTGNRKRVSVSSASDLPKPTIPPPSPDQSFIAKNKVLLAAGLVVVLAVVAFLVLKPDSNSTKTGNTTTTDGTDPGKQAPGKEEPGKQEPGKQETGKQEPGKEEPGKQETGKQEPGKEEPGKREPPRGTLTVAPQRISVDYQISKPYPGPLKIEVQATSGSLPFSVGVSKGEEWLSVSADRTATPAAITVTLKLSGLKADNYQGAIRVTDSGKIIVIPVELVIRPFSIK